VIWSIVAALAATMVPATPTHAQVSQRIAFLHEKEPASGIYITNANGSDPRPLRVPNGSGLVQAVGAYAWKPDGSQIAFDAASEMYDPEERVTTWARDVFVMNADGSRVTNLTRSLVIEGEETTVYDYSNPTWSPDGSRVAFEGSYDDDPTDNDDYDVTDILVMNADGSQVINLTRDDNRDDDPLTHYEFHGLAWSPDASSVASARFVSVSSPYSWGDDKYQYDLALMSADGTTNHAHRLPDDHEPRDLAWSPDGTRIAYATGSCKYGDIFTISPSGGTAQLEVRAGCSPAWSPDGTQLAFLWGVGTSEYEGVRQPGLWLRNVSDRAERMLSAGEMTMHYDGESRGAPSWSADGTKIAFSRDGDLYTVNADGTNEALVLGEKGTQYAPTWQPCPTTCPGAGNRTPSWTEGSVLALYTNTIRRMYGSAIPNLAGEQLKFTFFFKRGGRWSRDYVLRAKLRSSGAFTSDTKAFEWNALYKQCKIKVSFGGNEKFRQSSSWVIGPGETPIFRC